MTRGVWRDRTIGPGPSGAGAPTVSKATAGTVAAAATMEAGAGVTGGATAAVVPLVTLTTRRTTTMRRTRRTKAPVTRAMGARRTATAAAGPSVGPLAGVAVIVESSPSGVGGRAVTRTDAGA